MDGLKIEDVAKESGLTKRTIRYYEEIGLLPPPKRSEGGIRLYSREHIDYLNRLVSARDVLGFSLLELQQFVKINGELELHRKDYRESTDQAERKVKLAEISERLGTQLEALEQKMQKIHQVKQDLEDLKTRADAALERIKE